MTLSLPATEPEKVTVPAAAARTDVPTGTARSTPQWPAYCPSGANRLTTGPETGGVRPLQASATIKAAGRIIEPADGAAPAASTYRWTATETSPDG